jgi:hypothetical protein
LDRVLRVDDLHVHPSGERWNVGGQLGQPPDLDAPVIADEVVADDKVELFLRCRRKATR